jgi:hypothetical protein
MLARSTPDRWAQFRLVLSQELEDAVFYGNEGRIHLQPQRPLPHPPDQPPRHLSPGRDTLATYR